MSHSHRSSSPETREISWRRWAIGERIANIHQGFLAETNAAEVEDPGIDRLHEQPKPQQRLEYWPVEQTYQPVAPITVKHAGEISELSREAAAQRVAAAYDVGSELLAESSEQPRVPSDIYWTQVAQREGQEPPDAIAA